MTAGASAPATVLEVDGIHTFYGSIHALKGISLNVHEGEIVTLIGSNGAGKSTTLRSVNGLIHPRRGAFSPLIERSVVDLPAPFAPISVTISPSLTSREIPLSASIEP